MSPLPFRLPRRRASDAQAAALEEPDDALFGSLLGYVPDAAAMRRERRALVEKREVEIRDLGGLLLEMVRRDRLRDDLLLERAGDILALEQRIGEVDALLATAASSPLGFRRRPDCRCGAPLVEGARFCARCGRPVATSGVLEACASCGRGLPADAAYCPACGNPVGAAEAPTDTKIVPPESS